MPSRKSSASRKSHTAGTAPLHSNESNQRSGATHSDVPTSASDTGVELVSLTLRDIPIELRDWLTRLAAREQVLVRDLGRYILEQGLADIEKNGLPAKRGISPATRYRLYSD